MGWADLNVHTDADGTVMSTVSLRPDEPLWARCCVYADTAPIMTIAGPPETQVAITAQDRARITLGELEFARALAAETARYAEECERLYVPATEPGDQAGDSGGDPVA